MSNRVDIAVVGAGAAGIAAALCAARAGATTLLLDTRSGPGGTGGFSGLTTLCGLYDDKGRHLNPGFPVEFTDAIAAAQPFRMGNVFVLPYYPEKFRSVSGDLIGSTTNLQTRWSTPVTKVLRDGGRIMQLNGVEVGAVIDCSGDAVVARAIHLETMSTDASTQAAAVLFQLRNISRQIGSAAEMAAVLLPVARAGFASLSLQPNPVVGEFTAKFSGRPEQVPALVDFLRRNASGFEQCAVLQKEFAYSHRAGRMIVGQYVLAGAEVLSARKFPDAMARCAWPIEQWNASGVARFRYLPVGESYDIPARALRAARVVNLFMAGKTISADVDAIASARVMGCCLATGAAAGVLAAKFVNSARTS